MRANGSLRMFLIVWVQVATFSAMRFAFARGSVSMIWAATEPAPATQPAVLKYLCTVDGQVYAHTIRDGYIISVPSDSVIPRSVDAHLQEEAYCLLYLLRAVDPWLFVGNLLTSMFVVLPMSVIAAHLPSRLWKGAALVVLAGITCLEMVVWDRGFPAAPVGGGLFDASLASFRAFFLQGQFRGISGGLVLFPWRRAAWEYVVPVAVCAWAWTLAFVFASPRRRRSE